MNRKNIIIIMSILVFILIVGGVSYSYFVYNKDVGDVTLNAGEISIDLSGISGNGTLTNVIPKSDNDGKTTSDYFDFTVNSTVDTERIYYEVYILPDSENTLNTSYLKTYLTDQNDVEIKGVTIYNNLVNSEIEDGKVIYKGIIEVNQNGTTKNESKDFRLRLWLDENYNEPASKTFDFDIYLYAKNVDSNFVILPNPCPGCKFMYLANTPMYTTWNTNSQTPTILTSGLYDNYEELMATTGKNYFLGVKLNSNNEVTNAYACGVKENVPFCLEGTLYGAQETATAYATNKGLLQGTELYNNTCTVHIEEEGTANEYEWLECGPWDNSGSLSARAASNGGVIAVVGINDGCSVGNDGDFACSESGSGGGGVSPK